MNSWDGIGLPPVGCECLVRGTPTGSTCTAIIDYIDGKHCIWHWKNGSGETIHARVSTMVFSPIRSEEDRAVEEIEKLVLAVRPHKVSKVIYRAIRNGKIPGVVVEDGS